MMTLEEAIEHCKEVAAESREAALSYARENAYETAISCKAVGYEHEQIAEWLIELKQRRDAENSEKPKTSGDNLIEQSMYELLCDMNASFMNGNPHCVLEAVKGANMICKHESCNHCIAEWLKQEVSGND